MKHEDFELKSVIESQFMFFWNQNDDPNSSKIRVNVK